MIVDWYVAAARRKENRIIHQHTLAFGDLFRMQQTDRDLQESYEMGFDGGVCVEQQRRKSLER